MSKLTYEERKELPKKDFAEKKERKYPIEDESHARDALARVSQHGDKEEKEEIRRKIHKKFPGIEEKKREIAKKIKRKED